MTEEFRHQPVLLSEVLTALQPQAGHIVIDATVGGGGYAVELLPRIRPQGRFLGIDADPAALRATESRLSALGSSHEHEWALAHGWFEDIAILASENGIEQADAILFDLGVSSHQIDTAERGFSFMRDGPLDMRMNPEQSTTAADLVSRMNERDLADVIFRYGEERASRRIARAIVEQRRRTPIRTTGELADVIARTVPRSHGHAIHPATRTFQALRIAVNRELEQLEQTLPDAIRLLRPGGRLAVISFHSLEDRTVKHTLRAASHRADDGTEPLVRILTPKPIEATATEQRTNPRSRSARLRVAERLPAVPEKG